MYVTHSPGTSNDGSESVPDPAAISALPHEKRHQATHEADHEARYRDASPPSALEHFCECSHRCFHPIDSTEPVPAMRHPALVKGWFNRCGATSTKMGNRYYRCIGGRPCRGCTTCPRDLVTNATRKQTGAKLRRGETQPDPGAVHISRHAFGLVRSLTERRAAGIINSDESRSPIVSNRRALRETLTACEQCVSAGRDDTRTCTIPGPASQAVQ